MQRYAVAHMAARVFRHSGCSRARFGSAAFAHWSAGIHHVRDKSMYGGLFPALRMYVE